MDPLIGAAAISAFANLGGGFMSAQGAQAQNAQQMAMFNQQMDFQNKVNEANWDHAQAVNRENWDHALQMAGYNFAYGDTMWQRQAQYSNTAYQRAMADMRAAGLNPMLAYSQGGAGTPSGIGASGQASTSTPGPGGGGPPSAPQLQNTQAEMGRAIGRAAESAVATYKMGQEAEQTKAQIGLTKEQERKVGYETTYLDNQSGKVLADTDLSRAQWKTEQERQAAYRAQSAAAYAAAGKDNETTRQYARNGLPGYGLGERIGRSINEMPMTEGSIGGVPIPGGGATPGMTPNGPSWPPKF